MPKITRTYGRLHFSDLSYERFEDLSMAMVYKLNRWVDINHYGRKGRERGIDIFAIEELENEKRKTWYIQCKRYKAITKKQLEQIIDKISDNIPDVILLIISCDLSRSKIEHFKEYAITKGIRDAKIWTEAIIETKLFSEYHDLLFAFFGISLSSQRREKVATIRRNIKLKHRMIKEFLTKRVERAEAIKNPWLRFYSSEIIIRSINDNSYPESEESIGISPWFKVEVHDFYYNGLEVLLGIEYVILDENKNWDTLEHDEKYDIEKYEKRKAYRIGRIPFDNILEYDIMGDEYQSYPHIYCDFSINGMPYEEFAYVLIGDTINLHLEPSLRKKIPRF